MGSKRKVYFLDDLLLEDYFEHYLYHLGNNGHALCYVKKRVMPTRLPKEVWNTPPKYIIISYCEKCNKVAAPIL